MVILHSWDLVNWEIQGQVVADLNQITPQLNWGRMNRYGHGIWPGAHSCLVLIWSGTFRWQ